MSSEERCPCGEPFVIGFSLDSGAATVLCRRPKGHTGPHSISKMNYSDVLEEGHSPAPVDAKRESYVECECDPEYAHHCPICGGTGRKKIYVDAPAPAEGAEWTTVGQAEDIIATLREQLAQRERELEEARTLVWTVLDGYLAPPGSEFDWEAWVEKAEALARSTGTKEGQ